MTDDVSKLFPYAGALLAETQAKAVIVLAYGSAIGANGCAPALLLSRDPKDAAENTRCIRAIQRLLLEISERLEVDMKSAGIPFEVPS